MSFSADYLEEAKRVLESLDAEAIERMASKLSALRDRGGRLFILGVGGSAAMASHAVNDFRKICGIEAYAPTDNVAELSARANDEGWGSVFSEWLKISRIGPSDALLVFSVGGGSLEKNVSPNLVQALDLAKAAGATILGVVGRDGGHTAKTADVAVIVPVVASDRITAHTEAFHGVVSHLLVSHPALKIKATMWESLAP
jgi:D-sedoheptulose 7-phosphate isomerase